MTLFRTPLPELQITFYNRLSELRNILLLDALLAVVSKADIDMLNRQLSDLVSEPMHSAKLPDGDFVVR